MYWGGGGGGSSHAASGNIEVNEVGCATCNSDGALTITITSCLAGYVLQGVSCVPCPTGWYTDVPGLDSCKECPVGTYNPSMAQASLSSCLPCPAGSFGSLTKASVCTQCPSGTMSTLTRQSDPSVCEQCAAGSYNDQAGKAACLPCPAGTSNALKGQNSLLACLACSKGKYSSSDGQVSCTLCPAGTSNPLEKQTDAGACVQCSSGKYSVSSCGASASNQTCLATGTTGGGVSCAVAASGSCASKLSGACDVEASGGAFYQAKCPPGYFQPSSGASNCLPCHKGFFQPSVGQAFCLPCKAGDYNPAEASASQSSCLPCPVGTYQPESGQPGCIQCNTTTFTPLEGSASNASCTSFQNIVSYVFSAGDNMERVMAGNTPTIVVSVVSAVLLAFGLLLHFLRVGKSHLHPLTLFSVGFPMTLTGSSMGTEGILLAVLLGGGVPLHRGLAAGVLVGRLCQLPVGIKFMLQISGPARFSRRYANMISAKEMLAGSLWYSALSLLSLVEAPLHRFLPWLASDFTRDSGGYPDNHMAQLCTYLKLFNSFSTFACSTYFVVHINADKAHISASTRLYFSFALALQSIMLLQSVYETFIRNSMLTRLHARLSLSASALALAPDSAKLGKRGTARSSRATLASMVEIPVVVAGDSTLWSNQRGTAPVDFIPAAAPARLSAAARESSASEGGKSPNTEQAHTINPLQV